MQEIIQFALDNLNYLTITLFMAVESSFIPFPSEVVVPPAAWLACTDGSGMNVLLVILFATLGADVGALVNYFLARTLGRAVVYRFADSRFGRLCLLSSEKVAHSEEYFRRHGVPPPSSAAWCPLCASSSPFPPAWPAWICASS